MRYIKKFESFIIEEAEPVVKPGIKEPPTKPAKPASPIKPVVKPSVDPKPKAKKKISEVDVANRFIYEINKKGESIKKYLK